MNEKIESDYINSNKNEEYFQGEKTSQWGENFSIIDWIVIITIFFDTFGNILKFLPVLSGRPAEVESAKNVVCYGTGVLGCSTPIVSESEPIFLRGLIGRTVTALHTIGSRHAIKGLYSDTIINELRSNDNRLGMWVSWIRFIDKLARIRTRDMRWHSLPSELRGAHKEYEKDLNTWGTRESLDQEEIFLTRDGYRTSTMAINIEDQLNESVEREIYAGKNMHLRYDAGVHNVAFEGITKSISSEHQTMNENMFSDKDNWTNMTRNLKTRGRSKSLGDESVQDTYDKVTPKNYFNLVNLLPLICFLDAWLEEIKKKEVNYNYRDKT